MPKTNEVGFFPLKNPLMGVCRVLGEFVFIYICLWFNKERGCWCECSNSLFLVWGWGQIFWRGSSLPWPFHFSFCCASLFVTLVISSSTVVQWGQPCCETAHAMNVVRTHQWVCSLRSLKDILLCWAPLRPQLRFSTLSFCKQLARLLRWSWWDLSLLCEPRGFGEMAWDRGMVHTEVRAALGTWQPMVNSLICLKSSRLF